MIKGMGKKRKLIIGISAAVVLFGIIAWIVAASQQKEVDPYKQNSSVQTENVPEQSNDAAEVEQTQPADAEVEDAPATQETTVDPQNVSTVDVPPMKITVSYVKGIPGFEFAVRRTQGNVEYVAFSSPDIAGTKCTDDEGIFASIIANPSTEADKATVTATKQVGDNTYGLSLPESTCTSDESLFNKYQASFKDAFSLLKELENGSTDE